MNKIRNVHAEPDEVLLYRGHPDATYKILPSVFRESRLADAEHSMLRELVASHPGEFAADRTTLEQLARAQHYSLPTRLLDATWNPLVALFFAVNKDSGKTGEVVVFRVKKDRVKFFDSDTASCLANLAHLTQMERQSIDFSLDLASFNDTPVIKRLVHFIGVEKPHFRPTIVPDDLRRVLCVKPKRSSQRILVQAGAFLLWGRASELDTNPIAGIQVERIKVNGGRKGTILEQLDVVAINESTMFPEIDKAAVYIKSKA